MDVSRRQALKTGGGAALLGALLAAGFFKPEEARAAAAEWNKGAFAWYAVTTWWISASL